MIEGTNEYDKCRHCGERIEKIIETDFNGAPEWAHTNGEPGWEGPCDIKDIDGDWAEPCEGTAWTDKEEL